MIKNAVVIIADVRGSKKMAEYRVFFRKSVGKDISSIAKKDVGRIIKSIKYLEKDTSPHGCEKLNGQERYSMSQGRYCIVY